MDLDFKHGKHFFTEPEITFNKPNLKGYVLGASNLELLSIFEHGDLINIPLKKLYIRPGGLVHPRRLVKADISFPVWVCTGMGHNTYTLIDGRHRTARAVEQGHTSIEALSVHVDKIKRVLRIVGKS
jgi:hypothetical protein